jgi:transcriptional regulator with XRE-family HTH domain
MTEGTATSIQGARAAPRRGGRKPKIDLALAAEMDAAGQSQAEIAEYFGTSQQAVSTALKKIRGGDDGRQAEAGFPWKISRLHQGPSNQLYRLMLAYRKWNSGREVNQKELSDAKALQNAASKLGMAITYDENRGFAWTQRRPGEEEEMFVVRD